MSRSAALACSVVWVALAAGCGPELCPQELWQPCDAREAACVERVFRAIQCERGSAGEGTPPTSRVIDRDTYRAVLREWTAEVAPTPHLDAALQMLGVIDAGSSDVEAYIESRVRSVAAFYASDDNQITIIDRGAPMSTDEDLFLLAHEVTHATQHQRYDLTARLDGVETSRDDFERRVLVEGDAVFFAALYQLHRRGADPHNLDWHRWHSEWLRELLDSLYLETAPLYPSLSGLRYPLGAAWVSSAWEEGGLEAIDALWRAPTPGARELVRGRSTLPVTRPIACPRPAPPAELSERRGDTFGPAGVYAFLATSTLSTAGGWSVAGHVVDDRLSVYGDDAGERSAFQWQIRMDQRDSAITFESSSRGWCEEHGLRLTVRDTEIVISGASRGAEPDPGTLSRWSAGDAPCMD